MARYRELYTVSNLQVIQVHITNYTIRKYSILLYNNFIIQQSFRKFRKFQYQLRLEQKLRKKNEKNNDNNWKSK